MWDLTVLLIIIAYLFTFHKNTHIQPSIEMHCRYHTNKVFPHVFLRKRPYIGSECCFIKPGFIWILVHEHQSLNAKMNDLSIAILNKKIQESR